MDKNPFSFLNQTVNVLVVDDDPGIIFWLGEMLESLGLYTVSCASSAVEAVTIIETSKKRYHTCVSDLGIDDVEHDEFYLMDRYRKKMPFIVITARSDTEKGFKCGSNGVKETLVKNARNFEGKLLTAINKYTLDSLICPGFHENPPAALTRYVESLKQKNPACVNEWVSNLKMDDSFFRREWDRYVGVKPKYSLCIFHLFSLAFEYAEKNKDKGDFLESLIKNEYYQKCKSYFLKNESAIKAFICNK
jgi:CheY-like chemotaxis protein